MFFTKGSQSYIPVKAVDLAPALDQYVIDKRRDVEIGEDGIRVWYMFDRLKSISQEKWYNQGWKKIFGKKFTHPPAWSEEVLEKIRLFYSSGSTEKSWYNYNRFYRLLERELDSIRDLRNAMETDSSTVFYLTREHYTEYFIKYRDR